MPLDDDRAAGGEGGCRVTAGGREREREVARPEDGDRAERHHPLTQVRAGQGPALREGRVQAGAEVVPLAGDAGEEPQLTRRARELAAQAYLGKTALRHGSLDDRVGVGLDLLGHRLEEVGSLARGGGAVGGERVGGGRGRDLQLVEGQLAELGLERFAGGGGHGAEGALTATDVVPCDDGHASDFGGLGAHAPEPSTVASSARSSATSGSVRSLRGGRTGPAGRPTTLRPAFTMATA